MCQYCSYTDKGTEDRVNTVCQEQKATGKDSRKERQQMNIKLPC